MRVNFVSRGGKHLISYRSRILTPAEYLKKQGLDVVIGEYVPADVHIFSKHWNPEDLLYAKASDCPIFDVCDDHFGNSHGDYYRQMCAVAAAVVTSSHGLREIVERETRRKATVIYEPYEYPEAQARNPGHPLKVLWHGHSANLKALGQDMESWPDIPMTLRVVTNAKLQGPFESYVWRFEDMPHHMNWADVVVIPQDRTWKSPNKAVEAVRAGRFVICSPIYEYSTPYFDGMYRGDIAKGLEWLQEKDVLQDIRKCQERIRWPFHPLTIGKAWYDCILAAARSTSIGMDSSTVMSCPMLM